MDFYQWKLFTSFQKELINTIQSNGMTGFINECYLIDDKTFEFLFDIIDPNKTYDNYIKYNFYPPIIYDISSALKTLKNFKKLKLVKKKLMRSLVSPNHLKYYKTVNFYCGNNKLIIEFIGKYTTNALLIVNPLDSITDNNMYSFVIAFRAHNYTREDLYLSLLNNEKICLNKNMVNSHEYENNENKSKYAVDSFSEVKKFKTELCHSWELTGTCKYGLNVIYFFIIYNIYFIIVCFCSWSK